MKKITKTTQTPVITTKTSVAFYRVSTEKQENERQYNDVKLTRLGLDAAITKEIEEKLSGKTKLEDRKVLLECLKYV